MQGIEKDTLITIGGVQASVGFFASEGLVHQRADGSWAEGSGQAQQAPIEAPQADHVDELSMPDGVVETINQALEGVADQDVDGLTGLGISVATGQLDAATLEAKFARVTGSTPEEASAKVQAMQAAYALQADAAIVARTGIGREELPSFYEFSRQHPADLKNAIERQVYSSDFSGYRALADRYFSSVPPSLQAVQAAGLETRQLGHQAEVFMNDRWVTLTNAAKLGWL